MKKIEIPRERFEELYWKEQLTCIEISAKVGCSPNTVRRRMKEHGIPLKLGARFRQTIKVPSEPTDLAYLAGIIDGESHTALTKNREWLTPCVAIYNTSEKLMEWLCHEIGGSVFPSNRRQKTDFTWQIRALLDVYLLLKAVLPYLKIKKEPAERILAYCEHKLKPPL
jgi:hypothetical protein